MVILKNIGYKMPVDPLMKNILENQKQIISLQKENKDIKKILKNLERKIDLVLNKIQEFEVVLDAAELLEEQVEKYQESEYNTEWNPYDDEDFETEDYEDYDDEDDDGDVACGY